MNLRIYAGMAVLLATATARAADDEHPVFSLNDNRLLAHVQRGGGIVAIAGSAGFVKYVNFGKPKLSWKLGEKRDGKKVALSDNYSRIVLPVTAEQAKNPTLYVRTHNAGERTLEVKIAGKKIADVPVAAGWQTVAIPLGAVKPGEVDIAFAWGKKGDAPAVEWIQLGGEAPPNEAPVFYDSAQKALVIPQNGALVWYAQIPAKAHLVGEVSAGCQVQVQARAHDGMTAGGAVPGVALWPLAGKVVRMELTAKGCPEARLTKAALTTAGPAPTVQKPKKPKNVIFWIMDSLRFDKVRPWKKGARAEVPNLEKLATESTIFLNTYVQGNESRVSHASLWSGVYAVSHKMIGMKDKLDGKWLTPGEAMKSAGMFTVGVSSNGWIIDKWGFGDGWDAYRNHIHEGGGTRGEDVWKAAADILKSKVAKPFFLYLGTVDTHVSWRAHEPWISKYDPGYEGAYKKALSDPELDKIVAGKVKLSDRDKVRVVALYDSDVSYQDDLLGKIIVQLTEWGVFGDTMIVITADHGEEFWEDGRIGHGGSLREVLVHVPLLIYYPPLFPKGTAVEEGVDTIDILPTLLDAMGLPPNAEIQGESLIGLAQGVGRGYPRPSWGSQYEDAHAMRLGAWKIYVRSNGEPRVFDVANDTLEKNDLAGTRPYEQRFLTDAMSTFQIHQKNWKKRVWGVASNHSPQFADDVDK